MAENTTTQQVVEFDDDVIDLDALRAQREEATGSPDSFRVGVNGKIFLCKCPDLLDDEAQIELDEMRDAVQNDEISTEEFRDFFKELFLGDQAAAFDKAGGQMRDLNAALEIYTDRRQKQGPTQRPSRATRRRAKRR